MINNLLLEYKSNITIIRNKSEVSVMHCPDEKIKTCLMLRSNGKCIYKFVFVNHKGKSRPLCHIQRKYMMTIENYSQTIQLSRSAGQVFKALTDEIPFWWTTLFEGAANSKNDRFTVRFGDQIYKTIRVEELHENEKVVWYVEDSLIAVPGLKNQKEWIGTMIVWNIIEMENGTVLQLEHIGLQPEIECYAICIDGWRQFVKSLELYVETGKGQPF